MGQYKGRKENAIESIKIEAEAKVVSGYPTIIIKKSILQDIKEKLNTDIIKIKIHNHIETTYYWSLQNIDWAASITFKGLKPGKYTLEIEPYDKYRFIKEFNNLIREKHSIRLWIEKEKLILHKSEKLLITDKWTFEKEHGGAIHIIAEYPSITRQEGKIKIKFQVKNNKAQIYIQEPRTGRKRDVPYEIVSITDSKVGIILRYKHGKKLKTSVIMDIPHILEPLSALEHVKPVLSFRYVGNKTISGIPFKVYEFNVMDNLTSSILNSLMVVSYKFFRDPTFKEDAKSIRDQIGKFITSKFLEQLGYEEFIKDAENKPYYKIRFPYVKPDIIARLGEEWHIIEVKFRFKESSVYWIVDRAYQQVLRQFTILASHTPIEIDYNKKIDNIKNYSLIIVGYDHRVNRGYLYYHIGKVRWRWVRNGVKRK